jgi:hypothetical protein
MEGAAGILGTSLIASDLRDGHRLKDVLKFRT